MLLATETEAKRETRVAEYGRGTAETRSWLWGAGGDFTYYEQPVLSLAPYLDAQLLDYCDLFNQQCHLMGTSEPAIQLLNDIAAELMRLDWGGKLNVTDDFVVYAIDFELNHLERNMAASIPATILDSLREKGYL